MALSKIQAESMNLADTYAFTGSVSGAGDINTPILRAYLDTDQSIPSGGDYNLIWDNAQVDTHSGLNTSNGEYTVPTGQSGKYVIQASARFTDVIDNDSNEIYFRINGSIVFGQFFIQRYFNTGNLYYIASLSAGDVIDIQLYQGSGGSKTVGSHSYFFLHRLGE